MKAYICETYGPPEVLQLKDIDKPLPAEKEVLIKVAATTVNAADSNTRGLTFVPPGLRFVAKMMLGSKGPKVQIHGSVVAGEVVELGEKATEFKVGDRIYGSGARLGAYAEYCCRAETDAMVKIPDEMSYTEAAAIPYGALTAWYFLKEKANVGPGKKVLVNGASGGVGSYAVQLAKILGAEVTGVCSTANLGFVETLGADRVIDYTREDASDITNVYDVVFDMVVGKTSFKRWRKAIKKGGYYLAVAGGLNDMMAMMRTSLFGSKKVVFGGGTSCEKKEYLEFFNKKFLAGELKPTIGSTFKFDKMVEAHRAAESGKKRGNVVVEF